ncbi:hypothetical protein C8R45DRAFT_926880 [Mycena sanguinolenta]|nr:hypothetical protein C8R45DRAFT_926880 [Mycena sanguinolenta]
MARTSVSLSVCLSFLLSVFSQATVVSESKGREAKDESKPTNSSTPRSEIETATALQHEVGDLGEGAWCETHPAWGGRIEMDRILNVSNNASRHHIQKLIPKKLLIESAAAAKLTSVKK